MVNIRCEGQDGVKVKRVLEHFAESFQASLQQLPPGSHAPSLLGPAPAPLERVKGRERWQLLVKGEDRRTLHTLVKATYEDLRTHHRLSGVRLVVDVDPYDML
jgi:primosomal protein N' (replication factor Y)